MSTSIDHAALMARTRMAAAMGDIDGLRLLLLQAALVEPALVMLAQALILLDQGRPNAASAILTATQGLPEDVQQLQRIAQAQALIGRKQPDEAVTMLQDALTVQAQAEPEMLSTLARAFFQSGEHELAETLLQAVLSIVPQHYDSRYGMGIVRLMQGKLDQAIEELRIAQQVNPRRREPYQAIARAWRMAERPAEGAAELETLMREHELIASPGMARELLELYAALGNAAQRTRWLRFLESNAALEPGHRIELGRHWLALQQPGEIRRLLIGLSDQGDGRIAGWLLAGMAEQLDENLEQALAFYQSAAQNQPQMWFPQERTARLLLDAGVDHTYATHFVMAAEDAAPQTPEVRLVRALYDQARRDPAGKAALQTLARHKGIRAEIRLRAAEALRQHSR